MKVPPHPKKQLGQNFLCDENMLDKIVRFIDPYPGDIIFEIGSGTGTLTRRLGPKVTRLLAIEIDSSLLPYLEGIPNVEMLNADIRKLDLCGLAQGNKLRIVGNLPYYISTPILTSLIRQRHCLHDMTLLFQEEVAQRILAPPGSPDYGLLSVLSQYFCEIQRGFPVNRGCFVPRPEIDSRILKFRFRAETKLQYDELHDFLAKAFSQRRKMLRKNLQRTLSLSWEQIDAIFRKMMIPESARAEHLSAAQFEELILQLDSFAESD